MGTPTDLDATTTVPIKLRRALTLSLAVAVVSVVGSVDISGRLFATAPVAADVGRGSAGRGPTAVGGNNTFSPDDFESAIGGRYGGFDVAVINSRGIAVNSSGVPIVVVEVAIRNSTDQQLRLPASLFGLESDSGRHLPIHRLEHTEFFTRIVSEPGVIQTATLVVRLPLQHEADPSLYRLRIAEPHHTPLLLPLTQRNSNETGLTSHRAVTEGVLSHAVSFESVVGRGRSPLPISMLEVTSTLNHRAYRSLVDHHLVVLRADVAVGIAGGSEFEADDVTRRQWWSLASGDKRWSAVLAEMTSRTPSTVRMTVVFEPSSSATQLSLTGGEPGQATTALARLTVSTSES